jgi:hypothetical protein
MDELGEPDELDELVAQMRFASTMELYFAALIVALALPDMCGALASPNGKASGPKFQQWLVLHADYSPPEAAQLYAFRCSLLHQGTMWPADDESQIAFFEPSPGALQLHNLSTDVGDHHLGWISVPVFVEEIGQAVESWSAEFGGTTTVKRNMARFVRRRQEEPPPHISGAPVIAWGPPRA